MRSADADVDPKYASCAYSGRVECEAECASVLLVCDLVRSSDVCECRCVDVVWVYVVFEWNVTERVD